jgi:nucleoside-diphosphate-sugar epimerase
MKVLVIGGNGVIGHFVTRRLAARGERPVVMSRGGDPALLVDIEGAYDMVNGDVTDAERVDQIMKAHEITHVVHLGAVLPNIAETDPAKGIRANVEGTAIVLDAARKNGAKRVILASSKAVYGPTRGEFGPKDYRPMPEDTPLAPNTVYGISKVAAEELARFFKRTHGLEVASLRFGATIGPGKIARHGGAFSRFSIIVENPLAGRPVSIESGGDALCDSLFNDDVARGILCALDVPVLESDVYNIATGTGFSLKDYAAGVRRLCLDAEISIGPGYGGANSTNCVLDVRRARDELGFFVEDPSVDHILRRYVATMEQLGLKAE